MAAERLYALANHDYYDTLDCLVRPEECTPGRVADGVTILDARIATTGMRSGYDFALFLGTPPADGAREGVSSSSASRFAYVALPVEPGVTGDRTFCGDETGVVRAGAGHPVLPAREGRCPDSWPVVR